MNRGDFDAIIADLKRAEDAREQAEIVNTELSGRVVDAYSEVLVNIVAENLRTEEFEADGVDDGERTTE